jgi:L-2-hydroxyglutarate oxidase
MKKNKEVIVIGGGIVGLATALKIMEARPQTHLKLIEKESFLSAHQTGRNSGVIHSGIYYKPGSLKALNCRAGYKDMLLFSKKYGIPFEVCGKIVVATSNKELSSLEELYQRGSANGLKGLRFLNPKEINEIEPYCDGVKGLFVPQTGIINYKRVAEKYADILICSGAEIILNECVHEIKQQSQKIEVVSDSYTFSANVVVACAGLQSDRLALKSNPNLPLRIIPFRGEYYKFTNSAPKLVNHLIYPVPDPAFPFLGVHFTRMINGDIECGPNAVFAFGREAYKKTSFNLYDTLDAFKWPGFRIMAKKYWKTGLAEYYKSFRKEAFVKALQKLIPDVKAHHLVAVEPGIRAQACDRQGNLLDDFHIRKDGNIIHVCNAPSPAATASLAIGKSISSDVLDLLH